MPHQPNRCHRFLQHRPYHPALLRIIHHLLIEIRREDMRRDPTTPTQRLMQFLDLDGQGQSPPDSENDHIKWPNYRNQLAPVAQVLQPYVEEFHYEPDMIPPGPWPSCPNISSRPLPPPVELVAPLPCCQLARNKRYVSWWRWPSWPGSCRPKTLRRKTKSSCATKKQAASKSRRRLLKVVNQPTEFHLRCRTSPTRPARPEPTSNMEAGSGTGL